MKISVICVNWNSTDYVRNLLDSFAVFPPKTDYEFILVDNNSSGFDISESEYRELKIIRNSENMKYAKGNNQGIEIAEGDYILFLNPDIKIRENSVDEMVRFLENNPDYFGVCPRLILPDGTTDKSVRGFPYPIDIMWDILKLNRIGGCFDRYRQVHFDYDSDRDVLQPMTSSLLARKSILDEIGAFDEDFPIFFNDVDLCFRAYKKGYKIRYISSAEMDHIHGASTKRADRKVMQYNSYSSLLHFFGKHFSHSSIGYFMIKILINTIIKVRGLHP
ncbi:MAG: glycosyltransferase family 2 protein [Armatimonadetes bacterium]|nr:glycosyltransferase family 2 protein [Candidatus Hippobium faecium]